MDEKKTEQIVVRITSTLRKKLKDEAALQKRSEANLVTVILEDYFESKDRIKNIESRNKN